MQTVNTNALVRLITMVLGVALILVLLKVILDSKATGAIATLIFILGAAGACTALINPKVGLFLVVFEGVYLDIIKKVAVTMGEASLLTVIQVLAVSLITLGCVYLGIFLRMLLKVIPVTIVDVILFLFCGVAMLFFAIQEPGGTMARFQGAFVGGFYVGLIPAVAILLKTQDEVKQLLKFFFWCIVPFTAWAIYQKAFGFTDMEWAYANTWLSPVSSGHMLMQDHPRAFGLASGPGGFGACVFFPLLGVYFAATTRNKGPLYIFGVLVLYAGMLCAEQRTTLITPLLCAGFYWFLRNGRRTLMAYAAVFFVVLTGIIFAKPILDNLENMTYSLQSLTGAKPGDTEDWRNRVVMLNTFSDRLIGWERLARPKSYTLLGRLEGSGTYVTKGLGTETIQGGDEYSHDLINKVLIQAGVVGVLLFLSIGVTFLIFIHRLHLQIKDRKIRKFATLLAAIVMPSIIIQTLAGLTLTTNPINLVVWTLCGCLFALNRIDRDAIADSAPEPEPESLRLRDPGLGRRPLGSA